MPVGRCCIRTDRPFADVIAFLSNGVVLEMGTHEELLKKNAHYAEFVRRQVGAGAH